MKTIYVKKLSEEEKNELRNKGFKVIDLDDKSEWENDNKTSLFLVLLSILIGSIAVMAAMFMMILESPEILFIFIPLAIGMHYFFNLGEKDEK